MIVQKNKPIALVVRHKQGPPSRFNSSNRNSRHCSYCDRDHYTKETCWKLHGYPSEHPRHGVTQNAYSKPNGNSQFSINNVTSTPVMQQLQSTMD